MTAGVGYIRGRSQRASYWRTTWGKPHQFDSRSHQHSQASHPDFEPTYARSPAPGVYSSSLRPHRATRDERARAQGRVVRGSPRTRRDRADRAGSFLGPGSGAGGHHDRCPSRSGWADRRPIPPERRRASIQGSHLSPLTVRAPGSQRRGDVPQCLRTTRVEASPRRCSSLAHRARSTHRATGRARSARPLVRFLPFEERARKGWRVHVKSVSSARFRGVAACAVH